MKLNYKRTFFVGLAFFSICAFWQLYDNIVPLILTETFGMGETLRGVIMALDNVLALFLLPFFGGLSDRVQTKWGRRTPFIVIGTVMAVIFMIFMPVADNMVNQVLFLVMLGGVLLAMGTYRSPAVALMPDLTPKPLRSKANAVINLMGALGGVYTLIMIKFLIGKQDKPDYLPVFASVGGLMLLSVVILLITVRERKLAEEIAAQESASKARTDEKETTDKTDEPAKMGRTGEKLPPDVFRSLVFLLMSVFLWYMAYNATTTAFSSYARTVWGLQGGDFANCLMIATVAAVLSYIPVGILSGRFGRKKMILAGVAICALSFLSGVFFIAYHPAVNICFATLGIGWATINVNSYPMVVEMSSFGDIGRYTGLYYTFSMAAQIITPIASGFLLEHVSYRTLFPYSTIFMALAFVTMIFVRHGDSKPERKKDLLESFDVEDG